MLIEKECPTCKAYRSKKEIVCDICHKPFEKFEGDVTVIEEGERKDYCEQCIKINNISFEDNKNIIRWDF